MSYDRNNPLSEEDLKIIQKVLLRYLSEFHDMCVKFGMEYYAAHGTLLGAVRHEGWIPWEDDLDLMITSESLTKLKSDPLVKEHLEKNGREVILRDHIWRYNHSDYVHPARAVPFIDLFEVDPRNLESAYAYAEDLNRRRFKNFKPDEVRPLKLYKYENIQIYGPAEHEGFLTRVFGEDWRIPRNVGLEEGKWNIHIRKEQMGGVKKLEKDLFGGV